MVYADRVPPEADLVTYWFEKARAMIEAHGAKRAGLLATQGIRGGANRTVLERISKAAVSSWRGVTETGYWMARMCMCRS